MQRTARRRLLRRQPHVVLREPILQRVNRHDAQDRPSRRVAQENVRKTHDLQRLPQTHRMRQNAPKTRRRFEPIDALDQIIEQESHAADLVGFNDPRDLGRHIDIRFSVRMAYVDDDATLLVGLVELVVRVHPRVARVFVRFVRVRIAFVFRHDYAVVVGGDVDCLDWRRSG